MAVVDGVANALSLVVIRMAHIHSPLAADGAWINVIAGPTFPMLAALMLRDSDPDRPRQQGRLARLLLGLGVLCTLTIVTFTYPAYGVDRGWPLTSEVAWAENWLWTSVVPGIALLLMWFPTGELPSRGWRWGVYGAALADACLWIGTAFVPGHLSGFASDVTNPLGFAAGQGVLGRVGDVGHMLLLPVCIAAVGSLVARFWRGNSMLRAQIRWLVLVTALIVVTVAIPGPKSVTGVALAVNVLATMLVPLTLAVGLTRGGYALPRVLVFGTLSTLLLGSYLLVVGSADAALGERADRAASLVAAGLIAVLVAPVRARLQRSVARLVYGDRGDPHAVLSELGRRIAGSPGDLLDEVVRAVASALRAPFAAVVLTGDERPMASVGIPTAGDLHVGLSLRGESVGQLVVAPREPHAQYDDRDLALLHELARHIAVAAHAAALTRDLQRSRESLVVAREEERRRIRRDLHDGLGPALAGVAFGLDAARNTIRSDPQRAASDLVALRAEVQTSINDVRRLVYDLRPAALDQLGLIPALREYAEKLGERSALIVSVCGPDLSSLSAAVEVAAYRIATEAMTNAARHSRASRAGVVLEIRDSRLRVEVTDDGVGMPQEFRPGSRGIGITAMAERAGELGGTCLVLARNGGGTTVRAELPLVVAS